MPENCGKAQTLGKVGASEEKVVKKIEAIIMAFKLDDVKDALDEVGVSGMTFT